MSNFNNVDLIIGYGAIIGNKDMYFHLHFLLSKYEWDEKVTYTQLLKLKYSLDYEYTHHLQNSSFYSSSTTTTSTAAVSSSLIRFYEFHNKFSEDFTDEQFLVPYIQLILQQTTPTNDTILLQNDKHFLKEILSKLETWLLYLLNHLHEFNTEIQNFCSQVFFTSTISASCFRILMKNQKELEELFHEIQSIRSIVLEKANLGKKMEEGEYGSSGEANSLDDSSVTFSMLSAPTPLNGYNPHEHVTLVSKPAYQVDNTNQLSIHPMNSEIIPLNGNSTSSASKEEKIFLKGQPLAADSPLALKLKMLREASQRAAPASNQRPIANAELDISDVIEMLQSAEGVKCNFFIPMAENQESKLCHAKISLRHYLPKLSTKFDHVNYDPESCVLEISLSSLELHINVTLSFNVLKEVGVASQGIGSTVPLPKDQPIGTCFHVAIHGKPEALLSISDSEQFRSLTKKKVSLPLAECTSILIVTLNQMFDNIRNFYTNRMSMKPASRGNNSSAGEKKLQGQHDLPPPAPHPSVTLPFPVAHQKEAIRYDIQEELEKYDEKNRGGGKLGMQHPKQVSKVLKELNESTVVTIQLFLWIQVIESRWFKAKKPRLLLVKSDQMIDTYKIPTLYDINVVTTAKESPSADSLTKEERRQALSKRLEQMKRTKFVPSVLLEQGFVFEKSYAIHAIRCEEDPDEVKEDNSVQILVAGSLKSFYLESAEARKQLLSKIPVVAK